MELDELDRRGETRRPSSQSGTSSTQTGRIQKLCPFFALFTTNERWWSSAIIALVVPIPIFMMGFTIGFPSSAILDLAGEATELPSDFFLPTYQISIFTALSPIGAIFGGPIGGALAQRWGRKFALMFLGLPFITGYLMLSYAHYASSVTVFKAFLLLGRFISGVGMGWSSAIVPIYLGEVCSVQMRGMVGAISQVQLTLGITFALAIGAINNFRYYYISLVAVGIVALFEGLMIWLPETPRWLMSRGYVEDAERVLIWLRGKKMSIEEEVKEIKTIALAKKKNKSNLMRTFSKKSVLIPFFIVITIFFFQQSSGINATASFAATIFSNAGISNPRTVAILGVGVASLFGNFATFFLIDFLGRVTLLTLGSTGMFMGSFLLGIQFYITRPSLCSGGDFSNSTLSTMTSGVTIEPCNAHFGPVAIVGMVLYRFSFSVGLGPIPWILLSELLPLSVRGFASGLVMIVTWTTSSLVIGSFLVYLEYVNAWFAVSTFGVFNLAAAIFIVLFLPETKGKSLEQLEKIFVRSPSVVETVHL